MGGARSRARGNYKFYERYSYYVPAVQDMFILLGWLLVGALAGNIVSWLFGLAGSMEKAVEYSMLVSYPIMFIPGMIYASAKSHSASYNSKGFLLDSNHFGDKGGLVCALVVTVLTLALNFCADAIGSLLPPVPEYLENILKGLTQGNVLFSLISVSIFAPFFEEWLCRGMILRGLLNRGMKPVWAIVVSAVFFAVIHMNPWQAVPAFILGAAFGYVYYKTGSLKLTMLMHCVNNTLSVILSNIDSLKDAETWNEILPTQAYWIVLVACIMLVVLGYLFFRRIQPVRANGSCDEVKPLFQD